jgi:DHA1 family tetracycline resistance protein-like MFS transporter
MKGLGVLWLIVFISLLGFGITVIPFPLVAEDMGASPFWKTFGGAGIFSMFQLLATPLWGRLSDAWGRKPILIASLGGTIVAYVWQAYATDLVSLLLARALGGVMSGNLGAAFAYATDVTDTKNRAKGLGIVGSAFGIGFAVGPPIGGFLGVDAVGAPSLHVVSLVAAALALVAMVGAFAFLPESLAPGLRRPLRGAARADEAAATRGAVSPFAAFRSRPVLAGLLFSALVVGSGAAALQSVFQFWGRDQFGFGLQDVGLLFMVFAFCAAFGQAGLVGPLSRRLGEKPLAMLSIFGVIAGLLLFAVAWHPVVVWVAMAVSGIANGLFTPAISSLVSFEADARSRGAMMGLFNASSSAGRIIGPAVAGPIYFKLGPASPFVASAAFALLGAVLLSRAHARPAVAEAAAPGGPGDGED